MERSPIPPSEFDWQDRDQLRTMYEWAGSAPKLSVYLAQHGVTVSPTTLNYHRRKHGLEIANPDYRGRFPGEIQQITEADTAAAAKELLAYFKGRTVPKGRPPVTRATGFKYGREVIGCDLHAPLHHKRAFEVFLAAIEALRPDGITLDGDTLDLAMISRFIKRPSATRQLQADLDWAREHVFARINAAAPDAIKTLILGNHEGERWERYLWERVPEISELRCLSMEALLGLAEMGWVYEPDGYQPVDGFLVDHGDRHTSALGGGSAMSARKEMIDTGLSGASGHTHHLGKFYRNDNAGYRVWCECGCLCDQDKMREHRVTARKRGPKREDWHLGFAILDYELQGRAFDIKDVPILTSGKKAFCILDREEIAA